MAKTKRINARVSLDLIQALEELMFETGENLSEVLTAALKEHCARKRESSGNALKTLEETGFIASSDGPSNLSTNYKTKLKSGWQGKHADS